MRTLNRYSQMDQCFTKKTHAYTMDTDLYSVVIPWLFNPPISQFNSPCNAFMSVWSMFVCNIIMHNLFTTSMISFKVWRTGLVFIIFFMWWNRGLGWRRKRGGDYLTYKKIHSNAHSPTPSPNPHPTPDQPLPNPDTFNKTYKTQLYRCL